MSEEEKILLDNEKANIRKSGGTFVQTIPKRWTRRRDLRNFLQSDLEIALVRDKGQPIIVIRTIPREDHHGQET